MVLVVGSLEVSLCVAEVALMCDLLKVLEVLDVKQYIAHWFKVHSYKSRIS